MASSASRSKDAIPASALSKVWNASDPAATTMVHGPSTGVLWQRFRHAVEGKETTRAEQLPGLDLENGFEDSETA
jgi:hypothetical protein